MKQGLWVPSNGNLASINSDGFTSPSPDRLNKAVARLYSDSSKAEVNIGLIALNFFFQEEDLLKINRTLFKDSRAKQT